MTKLRFCLVALTTLTLISCDDWLTKEPMSSVTPEQYFTNESAVLAYVDGRYTDFLSAHGGWTSIDGYDYGLFQTDATTDNQISADNPGDKYLGLWLVPQSGGGYSFSNIYKCNWFFENVAAPYKQGKISGNPENIEHYIGEMYFLRAYQYFSLLRQFGDYPVITHTLADNSQALREASKRAPRDSVARFILQDLDSAILLMGQTQMVNTRISTEAALLLKSRVALFEGSWLKNFAGTAFVPCSAEWPGRTKDYNANYSFPHGDILSEANYFFDVAMEAAEQVADATTLTENTGLVQQDITEPANPYMDMFASEDLTNNPEVILWCAYAPNIVGHSVVMYAQRGNNGVGVTRGLVDSYLMKDGLPIYASPLYQGDTSFAAVRADRDPRLSCFLKEPGQLNYLVPTTEVNNAILVEPVPVFKGVVETYCTGYSLRKGNSVYQSQCAQRGSTTGCITFRSAEALLNYIEAYYERNGTVSGKALTYWQKLRERSGVSTDISKTIGATDMSKEAQGDWGAYTAGTVVDATRYNIRRERRNELLAEGLRWMDLIRWRSLDQLMTNPYHPQGIHVWSAGMQRIYKNEGVTFTYGTSKANVSAPSDGEWFKPYRMVSTQLGYNGLSWKMAYYLSPICVKEFLLTSEDGSNKTTSPLYQNPYWPIEADALPEK